VSVDYKWLFKSHSLFEKLLPVISVPKAFRKATYLDPAFLNNVALICMLHFSSDFSHIVRDLEEISGLFIKRCSEFM